MAVAFIDGPEEGQAGQQLGELLPDAAGVAAVLRIARAFKSLPEPPKRTIIFVAFAAEEIGNVIEVDGKPAGRVTAGAMSPFLGHGVGIGLMESAQHGPGTDVAIGCRDGSLHSGVLVEMPFYDPQAEIPRGKLVDIPERP